MNNKKIFIVEDNEFYAAVLKKELERYCSYVTVFASGEECLNNMSLKPDVVLLDYKLSGAMNGIEVLKKIRALSKSLPVFLLSGNYNLSIVKEAMRIGVEDFIDKSELGFWMIESKLKKIFRMQWLEQEKKNEKQVRKLGVLVFAMTIVTLFVLQKWF